MHPDLNEHQVEAIFCDINGTLLQQRDPEYEAQVLMDILLRWHFATRVSSSQLHDDLAALHDEALTGQYSESDLAMYTMGAAKVRVQHPIAVFICRHWASLTSQHIRVAPSVFTQFRVIEQLCPLGQPVRRRDPYRPKPVSRARDGQAGRPPISVMRPQSAERKPPRRHGPAPGFRTERRILSHGDVRPGNGRCRQASWHANAGSAPPAGQGRLTGAESRLRGRPPGNRFD